MNSGEEVTIGNIKKGSEFQLNNRGVLDLSDLPLIMGVINCTPDSFYPGSRKTGLNAGLKTAMEMIEQGADILDIGGESSRPGSEYVDPEEELSRVIRLIKAVRKESDVSISIDTRKACVAERALDAGANIINDISALQDDPRLAFLAAKRDVYVILMHKRGSPEKMQENPLYIDTVREIKKELMISVNTAIKGGIKKDKLIIDPGIGFGKRFSDNLIILNRLKDFKEPGYPVLIGLSRKSFIGNILGNDVEERLIGSIAANMYAVLEGADIIRVHDVGETVQMLRMVKAIKNAGEENN